MHSDNDWSMIGQRNRLGKSVGKHPLSSKWIGGVYMQHCGLCIGWFIESGCLIVMQHNFLRQCRVCNVTCCITIFLWVTKFHTTGQSFWVQGPEILGSIPGASRFSEKQQFWNGVHSTSWGQLRSYLEERVAAPVKKTEINDRGNPLRWLRNTLYLRKLAQLRQQAAVARSA
jgi:hypothetical protein